MNEIDWSKAPEGATHYNDVLFDWYKVTQIGAVFFWNSRTSEWRPARFWDDHKHDCIQRPTIPSWSGEGVPAVGATLEATGQTLNDGAWTKVVILAVGKHGKDDCVLMAEVLDDKGRPGTMVASLYTQYEGCFRPIRTPEQIAAGEREAAIDRMCKISAAPHMLRRHAEALYDAGYRKP